jgi:hypothetical protein
MTIFNVHHPMEYNVEFQGVPRMQGDLIQFRSLYQKLIDGNKFNISHEVFTICKGKNRRGFGNGYKDKMFTNTMQATKLGYIYQHTRHDSSE